MDLREQYNQAPQTEQEKEHAELWDKIWQHHATLKGEQLDDFRNKLSSLLCTKWLGTEDIMHAFRVFVKEHCS